jgi:NAD(P)-dependent dehydrogenase (short-subunit alcohol dehydrogenase family)
MESKSVLITGCSTGIGNCLAHGLRERGYRVFASARKEADVAALSAAGFASLPLDLDSSGSIRAAVETVLDRTQGRLYALINNGAYGQPGAVEDLSRAVLRAQFETNLFGTQELTNLVIPVMRAQGEGRIIQMSSMLGIVCLAWRGAYNATKFALEALSDTMRLELRDANIYVSLIEPGPIESRFRANAYAAFRRNIDREHSVYREYYARVEKRLEGSRPLPFTLPPEAVLKKAIHALEARRPKARYGVTFPTHLFAVLRRLLPVRVLDRILSATGNEGQR